MFDLNSGHPEFLSFSICDSSCQHLLHYFARIGGVSAEVLTFMADTHGIKDGQVGITLNKDDLIKALEQVIKIIKGSAAHKHRYEKLENYLKSITMKTASDETFYVHRCD